MTISFFFFFYETYTNIQSDLPKITHWAYQSLLKITLFLDKVQIICFAPRNPSGTSVWETVLEEMTPFVDLLLEKCLFNSFAHFIWLVFFLLLSCRSSLDALNINFVSNICWKYFFQSVFWDHSIMWSFRREIWWIEFWAGCIWKAWGIFSPCLCWH